MDSTRIQLFKNKEEHAQSANASQEVREHLAGFIRSKQLQGSGNQLNNQQQSSSSNSATNQLRGTNLSAVASGVSSSFQPSSSTSCLGRAVGGNSSDNSGPGCNLPPVDHQSASSSQNHYHHDHLDKLMANSSDDHPLRKTASMPTMHIPYKAQSLSRRRQMERRTTMSPLMKRKSKSRRQLLQSRDSNSTEHLSSIPCMSSSQPHHNNNNDSNYNCNHNYNHHSHHHHHDPSDAPRSLSQSNSPPPAAQSSALPYYYQQHQSSIQPAQISCNMTASSNNNDVGGMTNFTASLSHQRQTAAGAESQAEAPPQPLSFMISNLRELESLRSYLDRDSSYFSSQASSTAHAAPGGPASSSMASSSKQNQHQKQLSGLTTATSSMKDNFALQYQQSSSSSSPLLIGSSGAAANQIDAPTAAAAAAPSDNNNNNNNLRQQQHLKVTEAIKRSTQRATSRGKMTIGGSLDTDAPPSANRAPFTSGASSTAAASSSATRRGAANNSFANYKDERRQLSLDGADLRANGLPSRLAQQVSSASVAAPTSSGPSNLFNRDFYKLRMATTNDAAALRRSQSPSASILSGGNQVAAAAAAPGQQSSQRAPPGLHGKLYSSSSSSTSSLLSQQDSLEDSSSQAIDLSSSSEASRNRQSYQQQLHHHHQQQQQQVNQQPLAFQATTAGQQANAVSQHYQKMLQESFNNQLQLSSHQTTNYKQLLMNTQTATDTVNHSHHPPSLLNASRTATSLDGGGGGPAGSHGSQTNVNSVFASLADQFNLSSSAQNLILAQVHQDKQLNAACLNSSPMMVDPAAGATHLQLSASSAAPAAASAAAQQQPGDPHNQWLLAYQSLLQSSADLHQASQLTSSLLDKIPEPYKSSFWSHMMCQHQQQQQLQLQQQRHLPMALIGDPGKGAAAASSLLHHGFHHDDQRSLAINRTLSSPLLMWSSSSGGKQQQQAECQQQQLFQHSNSKAADQPDRSQQATVMMQLDTLQLTDKVKKLEAAASSVTTTTSDTSAGGAGDNNSIDLTLSSRSSGDDKRKSRFGSSLASGQHHHHHQKQQQQQQQQQQGQLNFNYTPLDPELALCSFIYNPVFDEHSGTGLVYELEMCNHKCICANENNHPENSQRILAIWRRLYDKGLMARCSRIQSRKATFDELQLCHSETYSYYFGKSPYERIKINRLDLSKLPIEGLTQLECGGQGADIDTAWNEEQTPGVARLAAGCVIEATLSVATGKLMNAFAIVRPPGHHAEHQQAMGFCFFNSVAIAAKILITRHQLARVLIVDWDVHHGNGIQKMFYHDKQVMYISLHRHDRGNFFPGTGDWREIGSGPGEGFNWNVAWSQETMGDAEYVAAFRSLVMPIAREFQPSMVLVACGFDAAQGHPFNFGGYDLSAGCFAYLTSQLMSLANGRLVLCLEGGYQITAICDCAEVCLRALLNGSSTSMTIDQDDNNQRLLLRESELRREPNKSACELLYELSNLAAKYWPSVEKWRHTIELSALEAANSVMR